MVIDLKKSDIRLATITPVGSPLDGLVKTDVTLPKPAATVPPKQSAPGSVPASDATPDPTIVDELQLALATALVSRMATSLETGGSTPFDSAVSELVDIYRVRSRRKSQGALTAAEFQRALDVSTSRVLASSTRPKTEQRLDSLIMRAVGEIASISTPDVALLPDTFNTPLLEQTQADLFNFGLQGGDTPLNAKLPLGAPFDPLDGITQNDVKPLFFAVGTNLVSCIEQTFPDKFADEFRISVRSFVAGRTIGPVLYNMNDKEKKFAKAGDNDFNRKADKPNRFEYAMPPIPLGVSPYLVIGFPYEEDKLTDDEVDDTVAKIRKVLSEIEPVLDAIIDAALERALAGVNPGVAVAVALFRRFLESLEIRERISATFFSVLSDFLSTLPGLNNDAFTPFTLSGTISRGLGDQKVQATLTASVGSLDARSASFPKTVLLERPAASSAPETIKTIPNVQVREVPLGAQGRYELTAVIAVRKTKNPPG